MIVAEIHLAFSFLPFVSDHLFFFYKTLPFYFLLKRPNEETEMWKSMFKTHNYIGLCNTLFEYVKS